MKRILHALAILLGAVAGLLGLAWLGTRLPARPYPPHPEPGHDLGSAPLPPDQPAPVQRFATAIVVQPEDGLPHIASAVVWGTAYMRLGPLWVPARFRGYYLAGESFLREIEILWYGLPIIRATDRYVDGQGQLEARGLIGLSESGLQIDQGEALALWAESLCLPPVLLTAPGIRWEDVDDHTAVLRVPFGDGYERLTAHFDPETGLIAQLRALRHRSDTPEPRPWRVDAHAWQPFGAVRVPRVVEVTWEDDGGPWARFTVDGVAYNVDVADRVRG